MDDTQVTIRRVGREVVLLHESDGIALSAGTAKAVYYAVKRLAKTAAGRERLDANLELVAQADHLVILRQNRIWLLPPWRAAKQIAKALYAKALAVEEDDRWESVVADGCLIAAAGLPFGLTNDRRKQRLIAAETNNLSAGGIYQGVVGAPALRVLEKPRCPVLS